MVFDLDGTLVVQGLDFEAMRREIGLPSGAPLLEAVESMHGPARAAAPAVLRRHELAAAETARSIPASAPFLDWLAERGIRKAVLSRNMREAVEKVLRRCGITFDLVLRGRRAVQAESRGALANLRGLGDGAGRGADGRRLPVRPAGGARAGTRTALVTHGRDLPFAHLADVAFASFEDLPEALGGWLGDEP